MPIVRRDAAFRKPEYAVLFNSRYTRRLQNKAFGLGLAPERRLPIGPDEVDRIFAAGPCPIEAPAPAEVVALHRFATYSRDEFELASKYNIPLPEARVALTEYAEYLSEQDELEMLAAMCKERDCDRFDEAELAEAGITSPAATDRDHARPAPRRPKAVTRHQRSKAIAKAARIAPVKVEDDFVPEPQDAISWATAVATELRDVALPEQIRYADLILADDVRWQFEGTTIFPVGPSLAELRVRLADLVPA